MIEQECTPINQMVMIEQDIWSWNFNQKKKVDREIIVSTCYYNIHIVSNLSQVSIF